MKPAITWIRDGVLIDRMPENAVSFAVATYQYLAKNRDDITLEELMNWCFEKSGISAKEKMELFNSANNSAIKNIEDANNYYTTLAEAVGPFVSYFEGATELINDLQKKGVKNYITSAIKQEVMNVWGKGEQGKKVSDNLEILGNGEKGKKGEQHFKYIKKQGVEKIYAVADAVSEIKDAHEFADNPVGFAHVITKKRVKKALQIVRSVVENTESTSFKMPKKVDFKKIILPNQKVLVEELQNAGAKIIITGDANSIMKNLRSFFIKESILED